MNDDVVASERTPAWQFLLIFLRLGLTSFGGPVAHIGYFRDEFVKRRRWLGDQGYADLVALCQFLPGPASSQVGMAIGLYRGGYAGAFAAWVGFTLPSAVLLILFALGVTRYDTLAGAEMLHGLKVVAVAVVAQAVWGMARSLCTDRFRVALMALACAFVLLLPLAWSPLLVIVVAGFAGYVFIKIELNHSDPHLRFQVSTQTGTLCLFLFFLLLFCLPWIVSVTTSQTLALFEAFYRSGSLVFGGGHVVLPLLEAEVVAPGWVDADNFLAGYGAAQAVPGPLFTFAGFLGASGSESPNGWFGGLLCLVAIFLPSFLLLVGAIPYCSALQHNLKLQGVIAAVNAAVVGILLAVLYDPVWTSAITSSGDFVIALFAVLALTFWKTPPWIVVALCVLFYSIQLYITA